MIFKTSCLPSSFDGTSLEIIDLIAINDVPFMISTSGPENTQ